MATAADHLRLYGQIRRILLARHFALGTRFRNDWFQEGRAPEIDRAEFLAADADERQRLLWRRTADRDNPWLFGAQWITALATEARLGVTGADALLQRVLRSAEALFRSPGLPVRWDPVTSDAWWDPPVGGAPLARDFLVTANGRDYLYDVRSRDPRHFPLITEAIGASLMSARRWARYRNDRKRYLRYRNHEASPEEMIGAIAAYVAIAEGSRSGSLATTARNRLQQMLTYLADHAFLMVQPNGGFSARGPGAAAPAIEWPLRRAIERACGGVDLSVIPTAPMRDALAAAGVWPLLQTPTEVAIAAMWLAAPALAALVVAVETGVVTTLTGLPLPPSVLGGIQGLGNLVGGLANLSPLLRMDPGKLGFAAGVFLASAAFDVSDVNAQTDMAIAALLNGMAPQERYAIYLNWATRGGPAAPWSTGWVPFLGLLMVGDTDRSAGDSYWNWLTARRASGVDVFTSTELPYVGYSTSCFASAVALLHRTGPEWSEAANAAEEAVLLGKLDERFDGLAADGGPWLLDNQEIRCALDYVAAVALSWRYRESRGLAGRTVSTPNLPDFPPTAVAWPSPGVPRVVVQELGDVVPLAAIDGNAMPVFGPGDAADLFAATSPMRPAVPAVALTFPVGENLFDETFDVEPGGEVATGAVLQWGDQLTIEATGTLTVGGEDLGPGGRDAPVWNVAFPLHGGLNGDAAEHALLARLHNHVVVGRRLQLRWLDPEETFVYLRLNQAESVGSGGFRARVRVRGLARPLARFLQVGCVQRQTTPPVDERPPGWKPSRRIVGFGGTHRDGAAWRLGLAEAWDLQEGGAVFFVRATGTVAAELVVTNLPGGGFRARTLSDGLSRNNLSTLPVCEQ